MRLNIWEILQMTERNHVQWNSSNKFDIRVEAVRADIR